MIQAVNMQLPQNGSSQLKTKDKNLLNKQKVGFKGNPVPQGIEEMIEKELCNQSKLISFTNWVSKNITENFKTVINAIGTAGIAPLMIIYNPLSKKDKDCRKYSALRQPVSAVLAVTLGALSGGTADAYVKKAAKAGKLGANLDIGPLAKDATEAAKTTFKVNNARVKALGAVISMGVGLLVMPLHAKILNLLYPPFAKAVAPDLVERVSKKKAKKQTQKQEGGTK